MMDLVKGAVQVEEDTKREMILLPLQGERRKRKKGLCRDDLVELHFHWKEPDTAHRDEGKRGSLFLLFFLML